MLNVTDTMLAFLLCRHESQPIVRVILDDTTAEPATGVDAVEHDLTEFVTDAGGISKELQMQDGIYSPGSHDFTLANPQDVGDFLFTLRRNIALNTWVNKSYRVLFGYRTAGGAEELITLYRGIIQAKSEDRIGDTVSVSSADALKYLNDYKFCSLHPFNATLNGLGFTDARAVQPLIKYGHFDLIERKDPFACTPGMGNNVAASACGINCIWLFPWVNKTYRVGSTDALYFWDYRASQWSVIPTAIYLPLSFAWNNYKKALFTNTTTDLLAAANSTWAHYLAGTGYFAGTTPGLDDIKVVAASRSYAAYTASPTMSPIAIILDVLALAGVSASNIDASAIPIATPAPDSHTFDYAFNKLDLEEDITINVDYDKQVSPLQIIQEIGKLVGVVVFQSADQLDATHTNVRRNLKLAMDKIVNPCKDAPSFLQLATNDSLETLTVEQNADELYSGVTILNFQAGISTKDNFDVVSAGSVSDLLNGTNLREIGSENAYLYSNHVQADAIAARLYNSFRTPIERYASDTDKQGVVLELGDYISIYDHKARESMIARIFGTNFDCINKVGLMLRRYDLLYGPDPTNAVFKVWAFCGCAHAGTDQIGNSGASASITIATKTVTLGAGSTAGIVPGMVLRIGGTTGGTSGSEYFIIENIVDDTHLTVTIAAAATHTAESWSAGKGYFAR